MRVYAHICMIFYVCVCVCLRARVCVCVCVCVCTSVTGDANAMCAVVYPCIQ